MPTLDMYRKLMKGAITPGEIHKVESDYVIEATWDNDISARTAYFYDWYHDDDRTKLNKINPRKNSEKVPMRIKFLANSLQTMEKDQISYHLQLKPSQKCVVSYYEEEIGNRYSAEYPIGLYCDIPDSKGNYNRWLVCGGANNNDAQFPTYELLRCDYVLNYIIDGVKFYMPCVLRSQSSYNSGVWRDAYVQITEDEQKAIVPLNRDTEKIYYNQRFLIDANVLTEPRAWYISKVNRIDYPGVSYLTFAQTQYNSEFDYVEKDKNGNVIGMWADYNKNAITPIDYVTETTPSSTYATISYNGTKAEIKIGGSAKKLTVKFYDDETELPFEDGTWSYYIEDRESSDLITSTVENELNTIKFKSKYTTQKKVGEQIVSNPITGVDETQDVMQDVESSTKIFLNKVLTVTYTSTSGIVATLDLAIKSL